jgi:hypothetical protein
LLIFKKKEDREAVFLFCFFCVIILPAQSIKRNSYVLSAFSEVVSTSTLGYYCVVLPVRVYGDAANEDVVPRTKWVEGFPPPHLNQKHRGKLSIMDVSNIPNQALIPDEVGTTREKPPHVSVQQQQHRCPVSEARSKAQQQMQQSQM